MAKKKATKPKGSIDAFADAAECLKTLALPVHLRRVQLLLDGRFTVGELAADCEMVENLASEHLRLLQRCGFHSREQERRRAYYQIAEPHLERLMKCVESRFLKACTARFPWLFRCLLQPLCPTNFNC